MGTFLTKHWNIGMIFVLVFGLGWIWMSAPSDDTTNGSIYAPQRGFLAPEFSLQTITGDTITLTDLRGQMVLINFWTSWCPPCRSEMPTIEKVYKEYREHGFTILAINSTVQDQRLAADDFAKQMGLTFPVLFDITGDVTRSYMIEALPTSFFVDRDGVIQDIIIGGPMPEALMRERIEKYIGEER